MSAMESRFIGLHRLGWNSFFEGNFNFGSADSIEPGRILEYNGQTYRVGTTDTERLAAVSGRLRYLAASAADLPAVGDWVVLDSDPSATSAVIRSVMPRTSKFVRKAAGDRTEEQVVAANVDI